VTQSPHTHARHQPGRHRRRRTVGALALCGAAVLATTSPAWADPPTNGSFETPDVTNGTIQTFPAGDPAVAGWTILTGTIDVADRNEWLPPDGQQVLDLSGTSRGAIEQAFPTTAGAGYTISWSYGSLMSVACPGGTRTATFTLNGGSPVNVSVDGISVTNPNWQLASTTFTGTGSPVVLRFTDTTPAGNAGPSCGLALDNIQIVPDAPVPIVNPWVGGAALGAIGGIGALGFALRRRRITAPLAA